MPDARREAALEQVRLLLDEAAALGPLLAGLPRAVLTARPFVPEPPVGARSVLEALVDLAAEDHARLRALGRVPPPLPEAEEPGAVLAGLRAARAALAEALEAMDGAAWAARGEALALEVARHDAAVLRALTWRLHEAHLTEREEDLPK